MTGLLSTLIASFIAIRIARNGFSEYVKQHNHDNKCIVLSKISESLHNFKEVLSDLLRETKKHKPEKWFPENIAAKYFSSRNELLKNIDIGQLVISEELNLILNEITNKCPALLRTSMSVLDMQISVSILEQNLPIFINQARNDLKS